MQYAHLLALIDAELDRLRKARQLLGGPHTSLIDAPAAIQIRAGASKAPRNKKPKALGRKTIDLRTASELAVLTQAGDANRVGTPVSVSPVPIPNQASSEQPAKSTPVEVRPRLRTRINASYTSKMRWQRKNSTPARPALVSTATALSGAIPAGPVFVPAEQIRRKQSQKHELSSTEDRRFGPLAELELHGFGV